jgi:hypothetical protein
MINFCAEVMEELWEVLPMLGLQKNCEKRFPCWGYRIVGNDPNAAVTQELWKLFPC